MIDVRFTEDKKSGEFSLKVKGHAGQAESGKDIVCSAASILAYTVAQIVTYADKAGKLKETPQIELNDGDAIIKCIPVPAYRDEIFFSYHTAEVGYDLLAHKYPQYINSIAFCVD